MGLQKLFILVFSLSLSVSNAGYARDVSPAPKRMQSNAVSSGLKMANTLFWNYPVERLIGGIETCLHDRQNALVTSVWTSGKGQVGFVISEQGEQNICYVAEDDLNLIAFRPVSRLETTRHGNKALMLPSAGKGSTPAPCMRATPILDGNGNTRAILLERTCLGELG